MRNENSQLSAIKSKYKDHIKYMFFLNIFGIRLLTFSQFKSNILMH